MISLQKSITEFDKMRSLEKAATECYCAAIRSVEQYLVEVDPADVRTTRKRLTDVRAIAETCIEPEPLMDTRGRLRGLLRDYQERAHFQIARLRADLVSALSAMESVAESINTQGGDHRDQLARELRLLKASVEDNDIERIRARVLTAAHGIETCVERMQHESQMTIAQLADEIHVLQDRVETVGKLITLDPSTGLLNHDQTELRVEVAASNETRQSLCLVYIAIRNYKLLCHQSGRTFADTAVAALAARLRGIFNADVSIGRWSDDEILVVLPGDPAKSLALSKQAAAQTAGSYPVHSLGFLRNATLQTQVLFLERRTGETARDVLRRIDAFGLGPPRKAT